MKLYPVCSFEKNQHKLFNYNDKMFNKMYDSGHDEKDVKAFEESERLLEVFHKVIKNGTVYATYPDYKLIRDIIGYYDLTH